MLTVNSQPKPSADVALFTPISRLTLSLALWGVAEVQVALWFHQLNLSFFFFHFCFFVVTESFLSQDAVSMQSWENTGIMLGL